MSFAKKASRHKKKANVNENFFKKMRINTSAKKLDTLE